MLPVYTVPITKAPCFPGCYHALEIIKQKNNMGIIGIDLRIIGNFLRSAGRNNR